MDSLGMQVPGGSAAGTTITVQEEGVDTSTIVTTLNFTGAGATASGAGATATINIPGGSGSDPATGSYTPGSFTVATGYYSNMTKRLQLTSTQRYTGAGTGRLSIGN